MRASDPRLVALTDALVTHLQALRQTSISALYPGSLALWIAPPTAGKRSHTEIAEYPGMLFVRRQNYAVRFYRTAGDWAVGLELDPDDDLFPGLIYRSDTAWSKDDALEAAWDKAVTTHDGLWGKNGSRTIAAGKPNPKDYRTQPARSIYVPME